MNTMSTTPAKPATYADLEALPSHVVGELLDGVLYATPRPAPKHAWAYTRLIGALETADPDGTRLDSGWHVLAEPEIRLFPGTDQTDQIAVPDITAWRRVDVPKIPNTVPLDVVPAWVCEIASPSTRRRDRTIKLRLYARAGVEWVWIVDPDDELLEVYRRTDSGDWLLVATHDGDETIRPMPFEHPIPLARLWS